MMEAMRARAMLNRRRVPNVRQKPQKLRLAAVPAATQWGQMVILWAFPFSDLDMCWTPHKAYPRQYYKWFPLYLGVS